MASLCGRLPGICALLEADNVVAGIGRPDGMVQWYQDAADLEELELELQDEQ